MAIEFRPVRDCDIAAMAAIRAEEWESEAYWKARISLYLSGEHSPQQAVAARAAFVALEDGKVLGFVAGHRTKRFGCDGELQWINVSEQRRGNGIAGGLLTAMAAWFVEQGALRVCVDVDPKNLSARKLYARHGAHRLNDHWMVWEDIQVLTDAAAQPSSRPS
jgi:GNAT superfamily N-acetyltransferase